MQKSFWWWQCSDRYTISLSPTAIPPSLSSLSLISLVVSVDVKHRVYVLPCLMFQFSDVLLYTTPTATGYRLNNILPLQGMKVACLPSVYPHFHGDYWSVAMTFQWCLSKNQETHGVGGWGGGGGQGWVEERVVLIRHVCWLFRVQCSYSSVSYCVSILFQFY